MPRVLLASALAASALAGCTPAPAGPPVVVLFPGDADDAWGASAEVLREELADDGYAVEVRFAGDDIPLQLGQLREALTAAPTAVVLAPVDATSVAAVLDAAGGTDADDVAVIAYDELVLDSEHVDYYATFDHRAAGRMRAEALVAALGLDEEGPDAEPVAIELLAGSGDDRGAREAFAGSLEVLQPYLDAGRLVVPSERTSLEQAAILRGSPATAADRVAELLDAGVPLAGVLSPSDAMSAAVAEVLADAGLVVRGAAEPSSSPSTGPGEPDDEPERRPASVVLTGGGSSLAGARAVRDGTQTSTVYEDPRELARVVASMVREVVEGSAPTVTRGVTTDNGIREVPTRLLEPRLVASRADAAKVAGGR